jgi:magnesium chelatase subunit D
MTAPFPFSAIVGNEDLKRALLLNVVEPRIGGVLIRGDRGTAKTTLVRALAALLPPIRTREGCPAACDPADGPCALCHDAGAVIERAPRLVELPLGATEDRVTGTLDLERALRSGERRFEPGLLAAAHRGVLYIDEVNLLPDHLVDLLLDVAASGVNVVERDSVTVSHPARFILVGTMNPEEGDLRPQLLDRFGLVVEARTPTNPVQRAEVVRRRVAFDADPVHLLADYEGREAGLRQSLLRAARDVAEVLVPEPMLALAIDLCIEAQADGLRPDLTVYRTARALAALNTRTEVTKDDVLDAALLALPHRQRRHPLQPQQAPDVDDLVAARRDPPEDPPLTDGDRAPRPPSDGPTGSSDNADAPRDKRNDEAPSNAAPPGPDRTQAPEAPRAFALPRTRGARHAPRGGRRGARAAEAHRGRSVGSEAWDARTRDLAPLATALARLTDADAVRQHRRRTPARRLVLLLVDGSGSMGARERMAHTKGLLLGVLADAYQARDTVALQVFRDDTSPVLVDPTRNIDRVSRVVAALPTGGRTPLAIALREAAKTAATYCARGGDEVLLVLVTDGRHRNDLTAAVNDVRASGAQALVVDTEAGAVRLGRARNLARDIGADYVAIAADEGGGGQRTNRPSGD